MFEQIIALVNTIFQYYILVMSLILILGVGGLLYWQRQNPLVQSVLRPFASLYQRLSGNPSDLVLQSPRIKSEVPTYRKARIIHREIETILKENKRISADKKRKLQIQTTAILNNIVEIIKRLDTVRRLLPTLDGKDRDEMEKMDFSLQLQIERSLETLQTIPISLVKVEIASEERSIDRLIDDLSETNETMHDLADSYKAMQRLSQ
jgi:hypothetical protein